MHTVSEQYLTILYLFIYFCICICIYNAYETFILYRDKKKKPQRVEKEKLRIENAVRDMAGKKKSGKKNRTARFRPKRLLIFHEALLQVEQCCREEDRPFLNRFAIESMEEYIEVFQRKGVLIKNYLVCLVGYHQTYSEKIGAFLIKCLNEPSVAIRMEVLRSIAKLGNTGLLMQALDVMDRREARMNDKMITDTLTDFNGDHDRLIQELLDKIDQYSDYIKLAVITYFYGNDHQAVCGRLLSMLESEKEDKEVNLRIIKYFGTVYNARAQSVLIRFALSETWEYAAVTARTLRNYPSQETVAAAKSRLNDSNWYIRFNNAETLAFLCSRKNLEDVLNSQDRYAREIMRYALKKQEEVVK
ncbi:hypothetical protein NE619_11045 [Anaerovorax odorimutans]|uniref:HEAT repeat domain-containing protein n=1 Tax=Anaerovorax odorimutans TaxID=109327 RepID=A0ABT1RPY2_9FIRM|nr:hypothetical protein [Anaerovorax odorimutans]MCQ4637259.1 hypothetical protein [Anaerovorax odorimutans]